MNPATGIFLCSHQYLKARQLRVRTWILFHNGVKNRNNSIQILAWHFKIWLSVNPKPQFSNSVKSRSIITWHQGIFLSYLQYLFLNIVYKNNYYYLKKTVASFMEKVLWDILRLSEFPGYIFKLLTYSEFILLKLFTGPLKLWIYDYLRSWYSIGSLEMESKDITNFLSSLN